MTTGGAAKSNGHTNGSLVGVETLGPSPSKGLISDLIILSHAFIVQPHLLVRKNPEEP
jgi:hypothetical protein